jgi:hypothetical protein
MPLQKPISNLARLSRTPRRERKLIMKNRNTFITVSNQAFYEVLCADAASGATNWTISRRARRGDRVLLYVCAPISSIVAVAEITSDTEKDQDVRSEWFGSYLADLHSLKLLARPIARKTLLSEFPAWGYWKQPRMSVAAPEEFLLRLEQLISESESNPAAKQQ